MRIPKRFGTRSLLVIVTLFGFFFASRWQERSRIQHAHETVLSRGGRVLHTWQDPTVGMTMIQPPSAMVPVVVNGKTVLRAPTRVLPPVLVERLYHDQRKQSPSFSIANAILGNNDDIDIGLIVIPCDQVDNELIDSLRKIKSLKNVMCVPVDNSYSSAVNLLKQQLPKVKISSGLDFDLFAK